MKKRLLMILIAGFAFTPTALAGEMSSKLTMRRAMASIHCLSDTSPSSNKRDQPTSGKTSFGRTAAGTPKAGRIR